MAAGTPLAAFNAKVRISAIGAGPYVLYQTKWQVNPEAALLDTSNAEGGSFEDQIAGLRKLEGTIDGWWDGGANMHDSPLFIMAGMTLAYMKLYVNDIKGPFWHLAPVIVRGVPMMTDVHGLVNYQFTFKAKGVFLYPTGPAV